MPTKKSNPQKRSPNKQKPTARAAATDRFMRQARSGTRAARGLPTSSTKQMSQERFPGETPLTSEDRPATRRGGKKHAGSDRKRTANKP